MSGGSLTYEMKRYLWGGLLSALGLWVGCGGGPDARLVEAQAAHLEAVAVYEAARPALDSASFLLEALDQEMGHMQVAAEALEVARYEAIKRTYDYLASADSAVRNWPAQLVEVPGFEDSHTHAHGHDHGHDHAHDHSAHPLADLPPAEMLALQQTQKALIVAAVDSLRAVSHRARTLLTTWEVAPQ